MSTNKKILIIEDEKAIAQALELKLVHEGFEAKAVFNGEEGIRLLQNETYALVLLDLMMPKMDGFMVLKIMNEKKIQTPVAVLSNLSQDEEINRAKALGVKEFFVKSNMTIAAIVEWVARFLA
ncbi:MAG: response regulator [Candidatus Pacebacteria bacterium]|nr:response regulator [Candidatus Paceibacterota bacterium]